MGLTEQPQTLQQYPYVHNDPINWADPTGQWRWRATGSIYHQLIEDDYMNVVMANPMDIQVEFDELRHNANPINLVVDVMNASNGDVYEIEPINKFADALPQTIGYVLELNLRGRFARLLGNAPSLQGPVRPVPGLTYNYNGVIWHPGAANHYPALHRIPLGAGILGLTSPGIADLVATAPIDGVILYWVEPHDLLPATLAAFAAWRVNRKLKRPYNWWPGLNPQPQPLNFQLPENIKEDLTGAGAGAFAAGVARCIIDWVEQQGENVGPAVEELFETAASLGL